MTTPNFRRSRNHQSAEIMSEGMKMQSEALSTKFRERMIRRDFLRLI